MTSKAAIENELRSRVMNIIVPHLEEGLETDVLDVAVGEYTLPLVDINGNEVYVNIKVSVPRGTRAGNSYIPYDGYAAHEEWEMEKADRAEKKRKAEENKQARAAKKEHAKELKACVKNMKQDIAEILPSQAI